MEHIKRAVEIAEEELLARPVNRGAKREQPARMGPTPQEPNARPEEVVQVLPASAQSTMARAPKSTSPENIAYTETCTIRLSPDSLRENRVILSEQNDIVAGAYKMLRTQVLQRMRENDWKALGITSCRPGEGKSLTAINLAISLAKVVNYTVLLVDGDLRRPRIHEYLDYEPKYGLDDYLIDDVPLKDILVNPQIERLVILPGRKPVANSSELLSSPKMGRLVDDLKSRYPSRLVVFDLPPVLATDDALAFSSYIDAILLVLERGKTDREEIKRAGKLLRDTNLIGTVLNKSDEENPGFY